jgi:hypothetical protein
VRGPPGEEFRDLKGENDSAFSVQRPNFGFEESFCNLIDTHQHE